MLGNIGLVPLLFIILILLLMFGPNKLPELGRALGKTLREFKKGTKEMIDEEEDDKRLRKDVGGTEVIQSSEQDGAKDKDNRRLPD